MVVDLMVTGAEGRVIAKGQASAIPVGGPAARQPAAAGAAEGRARGAPLAYLPPQALLAAGVVPGSAG